MLNLTWGLCSQRLVMIKKLPCPSVFQKELTSKGPPVFMMTDCPFFLMTLVRVRDDSVLLL